MGPWKGGVRSRFLWRGHGEVTKKNEVKGQQEKLVRGHEIFQLELRGLEVPIFSWRGQNMWKVRTFHIRNYDSLISYALGCFIMSLFSYFALGMFPE